MAKEKKIILFLSANNPSVQETYTCPSGEPVKGRQTNEAPLRYLLRENKDVSEILCLVTREADGTPWKYIQEVVSSTDTQAKCTSIQYSEDVPVQESLSKVLNHIKKGDEILLDVTGGFRSTMMYLMLISRAMSYMGVETSCAVYSNYQRGRETQKIEDVTEMLQVFNLIDGMQNLTSFGNVRKLQEYYKDSEDKKISALLTASNQLWEYITLCRPNLVADPIKAFNDALNAAEENCSDPLLQALLPAFRATFGNEMTIVHLIRWCANNDMIQQALTLYRERIPDYIMNERPDILAVDPKAQPLNMKNSKYKRYKTEWEARFQEDFLKMGRDWCEKHPENQPACNNGGEENQKETDGAKAKQKGMAFVNTLEHFEEAFQDSDFTTDCTMEQLRLITTDYMYLHILRNMADHADNQTLENQQPTSEYLAKNEHYKKPEDTTVQDVKDSIIKALNNLEPQPQTT